MFMQSLHRFILRTSPASCLMVSQLQQLSRGMCQILLPVALHLCHILTGLMMDLDSFS